MAKLSELDSKVSVVVLSTTRLLNSFSEGLSAEVRVQLPGITASQDDATETQPINLEPVIEEILPEDLDSSYTMSRRIETITDLWIEWKEGIDGGPSIQSLEFRFNCSWRRSLSERKWFSRCNKVVEAIKTFSRKYTVSLDVAAERMERLRLNKGISLSKLKDLLFKKSV